MATNSQTNANRENAQHSTGPKTPEGKKRSSLNAMKFGLTGRTVMLPGDERHGGPSRNRIGEFQESGLHRINLSERPDGTSQSGRMVKVFLHR